MLMSACNENKSDSSVENFDPFDGVNLETVGNLELSESRNGDLKVTLMDEDANKEIESGGLYPNSIYTLVATSSQAGKLIVRKKEYFEILSQIVGKDKTIFTIRTDQQNFAGDLFISIIPVVQESKILKRQPARGFLISK